MANRLASNGSRARRGSGTQARIPRMLMAGVVALAVPWPAAGTASGPRRQVVDTIIVHTIGGPSCVEGKLAFSGAPGDAGRWKAFFDRHPFLGIHFVVDRDGVALASTPEDRFANHALDNNDTSIGIELVHEGDGIEPFGKRQIDALIRLIRSIRSRYAVPIENIKGHSDVDVRTFACGASRYATKMDPGANFPWELARAAVQGEPHLIAGPSLATPRPPAPVRGPFPAVGDDLLSLR
jgi:N-acetylmuramoyl-L-alanine amidase